MKKLSKLFLFLTFLYTPSTVEGADFLPSTKTLQTFGQNIIAAKNITLANTSIREVLTHGGRFVVDLAAFGAVFYIQPASLFTSGLGVLALLVSGQRIKESATSYWAWLQEKTKPVDTAEEGSTAPKDKKDK